MANGNLLILGATSPTGQHVVSQALEKGWRVAIYGRRTLEEHKSNENIKSFEGAIDDEAALRQAIRGQDVIVSVVGPSSPFAAVDVFPRAYGRILAAMRAEGVRRILALSTYSVYDANDRPNLARWALVTLMWALAHRVWKAVVDVSRVFEAEQDIDWTLFRVGFLGDGPVSGRVAQGYVGDGALSMYVKRADIAAWVLAQADESPPELVRQKPGICTR